MATLLLEATISGALLGLYYALLASGFSLIFGVTRVLNLAHGELLLLAAYLGYILWKVLGLSPLLTLGVSIPLIALSGPPLGGLFARLGSDRNGFELRSLTLAFGLSLLLQNLMLLAFTSDYRLITWTPLQRWIALGPVAVEGGRLLTGLLSLICLVLLHGFLTLTYTGRALRAVAEERTGAQLLGIDVRRMEALSFTLGAALIGIAGPLLGSLQYLTPSAGISATVVSLILTILGGVGRMDGLLFAGVLFGIAEGWIITLTGPAWREAWIFTLLLALLNLRRRLWPGGGRG